MSEITGQPLEENDKGPPALQRDDGPLNDNGKRLTEDILLEIFAYANDDGRIIQIGPNGIPAGVDPDSVFPLKIHKSQLKNLYNPPPGAQNWDKINTNTTTTSTTAPTASSTAPRPSVVVRAPPQIIKLKLPEPSRTAKLLPPQPVRTPIAPIPRRKISKGDSANNRRSKRQQGQYEKQEADGIQEENQQMLKREKEKMKGRKKTPLPIVQVSSNAHMTPAPAIHPPQKVLDKEKSTPGSSKVSKRKQKLPPHLNGPNFIKDDPEGVEEGPEVIELDSQDEDFKEDKTGDETETATEGEVEDIDDPDRLWCICRKPHNDRFMICCDKCEEWFHGSCVNVTKAQGKQIEERGDTWICPPCKKKAREEKLGAQKKKREEMTCKKRGPGEILVSQKDPKVAGSAPKKGRRAPGSSTPSVSKPKLPKRPSIDRGGQGRTLRSASNPSTSSASEKSSLPLNECVVCSKPARPGLIYCGICIYIIKYHESTRLATSHTKKSSTVLSEQQKDKLKSSSTKSEGDKTFPGLRFDKDDTTKTGRVTHQEITDKPTGFPQKSDQELQTSTIKTPSYSDDPGKREEAQKPIFRRKIVIHSLGSFNVDVFHCSHNPGELEPPFFPDSPVTAVGHINPVTIWDYIEELKKLKVEEDSLFVFRLEPASIADKESYITFFEDLYSKNRLGIFGSGPAPIKHVFLLALDKHTPIPPALQPFHGPGLSKDRKYSLLAIVTRYTPEPSIL